MTTFDAAVRVPPITHDTVETAVSMRTLQEVAHLLLDQRDTARSLAVTLEEQTHLLRVALASADAMLARVETEDYWSPGESRGWSHWLGDVRQAVTRALAVTA